MTNVYGHKSLSGQDMKNKVDIIFIHPQKASDKNAPSWTIDSSQGMNGTYVCVVCFSQFGRKEYCKMVRRIEEEEGRRLRRGQI